MKEWPVISVQIGNWDADNSAPCRIVAETDPQRPYPADGGIARKDSVNQQHGQTKTGWSSNLATEALV
ncbi:MAG: hypothetical protein AMJ65_08875 [Phycisphaerae bacterium SG8_4]|nr:MAG: hypothetical protein AMJ65_08875 [Phycisphaerae bacterium SG8_4]